MIIIKNPTVVETEKNKVRQYCEIEIESDVKKIWFEVDSKYKEYLVTDRADAYVIGLLNYAMRNNHDIKCDIPVTDELLYNLNEVLIPMLAKYSSNLNKIKINAKPIKPLKSGEHVGTGCSCGIDSFYSIKTHRHNIYESLELTDVCINNVGAFNECYKDYGEEKVKKERYEVTKKVAKDLKLNLIETDSNFFEEIPQNHLQSHTYLSTFAIYMLQKYWRIYYYASSGHDFSTFSLKDNGFNPCADYELLSLQCFSTSAVRIYSDGGEKERLEKTAAITDFSYAQKYLHVCLHKSTNCGVCSKCMRTLTALDALDKLDNFDKVFDIEYYKQHKKDYYNWMWLEHKVKDVMNEPTYKLLKKQCKIKVSLLFKLKKYPYILAKNCIPRNLKNKIKKIIGKE